VRGNDPSVRSVQTFLANSLTISIVRGMGPEGTLDSVRQFMKSEINLEAISNDHPSAYPQTLDEITSQIQRSMPRGGNSWGTARKCLNLFFRDCFYNFYIRKEYGLEQLEGLLEIPLDSYVGKALRKDPLGLHLPAWRSVKSLTKSDSANFQDVALRIAGREGTGRVHLDLDYWRDGA
jgi:hypothetical protein